MKLVPGGNPISSNYLRMNSLFTIFSPQQWRVLQALYHYRFLTVDQMIRLGLSKNPKSLRDKTLFALRHHECIQSEKIGSFLPDLHHLTAKGQDILCEVEGVEKRTVPNKKVPFSAIFAPHRFAQVDFQIGLHQWAESRGDAELVLELQDFLRDPAFGKSYPKASTELHVPSLSRPVIPDSTFAVALTNGKSAMYLVEIHRSSQTKVVTDQLARYFEVIKSGVARQKYGINVNPIICSVHHQPPVLENVKQRLRQHPEFAAFKSNFVFHRLDSLQSAFAENWHFADDSPANPFPLANPTKDEN